MSIFLVIFSLVFLPVRLMAAEEDEFDSILRSERIKSRPRPLWEEFISGGAAYTIGMYGYYNDDRGHTTRMIYGLIQTAGIVTMGSALRKLNEPNITLDLDRYFKTHGILTKPSYERYMIANRRQEALANWISIAFTSTSLFATYMYNASRTEEKPLKNVYYFFSVNLLATSAYAFYRVYRGNPLKKDKTLSFEIIPAPRVTYRF